MVGDGWRVAGGGLRVAGTAPVGSSAMSALLSASTSHRRGGTVRRESRTQRQQRHDEAHL